MNKNSASPSVLKENLAHLSNVLENDDLSFEDFFNLYAQFLNLIKIVLDLEKNENREFKIISRNSSGELLLDPEGFPILNDFNPEQVTD